MLWRSGYTHEIHMTYCTYILILFTRVPALKCLSWLVCASGEGVLHPSIGPSGCLCVIMSKCPGCVSLNMLKITPINIYTLYMYFSLRFPFLTLSIFHPFLFLCLCVSQGSTESCNNTEEEEMKGRKGTCPAFTYSACLV